MAEPRPPGDPVTVAPLLLFATDWCVGDGCTTECDIARFQRGLGRYSPRLINNVRWALQVSATHHDKN